MSGIVASPLRESGSVTTAKVLCTFANPSGRKSRDSYPAHTATWDAVTVCPPAVRNFNCSPCSSIWITFVRANIRNP
jgi:hypothetical protein